jgi:hypothetical protein
MKAARFTRCVALAMALAVAGCSDSESIRVLDEPKPQPPAAPTIPADQKQYRTLAAMVPADTGGKDNAHWWFFKMSGKAEAIARSEADFDKLIATVHSSASADEPISWELPLGWQRTEGSAMRFATLKAPGGEAEVAVSQAGGSVVFNAQRWWGQLWGEDKAIEITPVNMDAYVRRQVVKGRLILRVDMSGPKDPNAKRPMMMNPHGGQ